MSLIVRRFENWPTRLSEFLAERQNRPFEWGQHDCVLYPADCISHLTGYDLGTDYRGVYSDEAGAQAMLDRDFGGVISGVFYEMLGQPNDFPMMSKRGDIVLADVAGKATGGVVDDTGRRVAFITMERGLIRLPLTSKMITWGY